MHADSGTLLQSDSTPEKTVLEFAFKFANCKVI